MTPVPQLPPGARAPRHPVRWLSALLTVVLIAAALGFIVSREGPGAFWQGALQAVLATPAPTETLTPAETPTPVPLDTLRARTLHLPIFAPGEACPVIPGRTVNPNIEPALGDGPVYLVSLGTDQGAIEFAPAKNFDSPDWDEAKTIFAVRPEYHGFVLLRGHQLDGPNEVRFGNGDGLPDELIVEAGPSPYVNNGWTYDVTYTRVRAPGCYAVQADGSTFSEVIVFKAQLAT